MSEYTKKQRHEIYKQALEAVNRGSYSGYGLCFLIRQVSGVWIYDQYLKTYEEAALPELWMFIDGLLPFYLNTDEESWDLRKQILMFCIEMTR